MVKSSAIISGGYLKSKIMIREIWEVDEIKSRELISYLLELYIVGLSCQRSNYQFLPKNVIYFSYISGIPMVSTPEIDRSSYQSFDN